MISGLPPFYSEDEDVMNVKIQTAPLSFDDNFSPELKDFISGLLQRDPNLRLGAGPNGTKNITSHPWFKTIDWRRLYHKEVEPPFKPHLKNPLDLKYFDEEFIHEDPKLHPKKPKNPIDQDQFVGFSYDGESELTTYMERRKSRARKKSIVIIKRFSKEDDGQGTHRNQEDVQRNGVVFKRAEVTTSNKKQNKFVIGSRTPEKPQTTKQPDGLVFDLDD
eukprot:TRINITY_DN7338_c0_g1_i1.p1 TRINITY_DN7338_c0_g1~~TRINITY_DN7338_c0_g1_i1.p1  ORF type:complete len:219 (+),score=49.02 TRINITY_DN7338_c0_g1_i1:174-830(+)